MNKLSIILLLAMSCKPAPSPTPKQQAVTRWLKRSLRDSIGYQAVNWGIEQPWRRQDDARDLAYFILEQAEDASVPEAIKLCRKADSLLANRDTTRLGTLLTHIYMHHDMRGSLQLDTAQFVVYLNGKVQMF